MLVSVKIYGDIIADGTIFASLTFNSPDLLSKSPVLSDKMPLDKTECVHVQGDRGILGMQGRRSNRGVAASQILADQSTLFKFCNSTREGGGILCPSHCYLPPYF